VGVRGMSPGVRLGAAGVRAGGVRLVQEAAGSQLNTRRSWGASHVTPSFRLENWISVRLTCYLRVDLAVHLRLRLFLLLPLFAVFPVSGFSAAAPFSLVFRMKRLCNAYT